VTGAETTTLSGFSSSGSDPVTHTLGYDPSTTGTFNFELRTAADEAGNDGAGGETTGVTLTAGSSSGGGGPSPAGSASDRISSARAIIFDDSESITLPLSTGTVSRVRINSSARTTGTVLVTIVTD